MLTLLAWMSVASAEPVASVLMVQGRVYIDAGGEERAAAVGMELDRDDGIFVDMDASLYVLLKNNRVVALGEDIEIPAGRIAGVDGARVETSVKQQLAEILSPSDRERLGPMVSQAEGIGGWHARMTSAVAPVRGGAPSRSRKRSAAPAADRAAPADKSMSVDLESAAAGGPPPAPPPPPAPAHPPLSTLVAAFQPDGAESKCLRKWAKKLSKDGTDSLELTVKLDDASAIEAVFTMQGEAVPDCLTDALMGKKTAGELTTPLRLQ